MTTTDQQQAPPAPEHERTWERDDARCETYRFGDLTLKGWQRRSGAREAKAVLHSGRREATRIEAVPFSGIVSVEVEVTDADGTGSTVELFLSPAQAVALGQAALQAGVEAVVSQVLPEAAR